MLKSALSISFVALCILAAPAYAQDTAEDSTYQVYKLPKGTILSVGVEHNMCYSFEQYQLLLKLDNELRLADGTALAFSQSTSSLRTANLALSASLKVSNQQLVLMTEQRNQLFLDWKGENLARHKAENKPVFGSWIPWTVAGVSAALAAGLVVGVLAL